MKKKRCILFLLLLLLTTFPWGGGASVEFDTMYADKADGRSELPIPKAYVVSQVISVFGADADIFNEPTDVCVAPSGRIFVADTGNHRIVELDAQYRFVAAYDNAQGGGFKSPESVFVDADGGIFVADTGNERVVKLAKDGTFVEAFEKPDSALLTDSFTFNPRKIAVSDVGYLYAIKFQNLMQIDAFNRFRGFIGTNMVKFDLWRQIRILFSNAEQRKVMQRQQPYSVYSFAFSPDGAIYITTPDEEGQLKKINTVGKNIYPKQDFFGFNVRVRDGMASTYVAPQYIDLAVDKAEMVYMLEGLGGTISVYDSFGNNLANFSGRDPGDVGTPRLVALDVTASRDIIIVDRGASCLRILTPTRFMNGVFDAVTLYGQGRYVEAEKDWENILENHESHYLANQGMAKAKLKQGEWQEAMVYYERCDDVDGYSQAFDKYRLALFREHFGLVVAAIGLLGGVIGLVLFGAGRFIHHTMKKYDHLV